MINSTADHQPHKCCLVALLSQSQSVPLKHQGHFSPLFHFLIRWTHEKRMEKPKKNKREREKNLIVTQHLLAVIIYFIFCHWVSDGLFYFFPPTRPLEQIVFWERTTEGLTVFRVVCRGPDCVNVECIKTNNKKNHNAADCDLDSGAIVAGFSVALCHHAASWWCLSVTSTFKAQVADW